MTGRQRKDGAGLERRAVLEIARLVDDHTIPDDRPQQGKSRYTTPLLIALLDTRYESLLEPGHQDPHQPTPTLTSVTSS